MPISPRSRMPATATRSLSTSASPLRPPSSPTSSTASPTSTSPQSRKRLHGSVLKTRSYDNERAYQYFTQSACRCLTQVRPARRRSRLPHRSRLDGDHVFLLRLPEVVGL